MNNIAKLRKSAGLSQAELGKLIGAAQNTICNWENGKREPDNDMIRKLADVFCVSTDCILGRDEGLGLPSSPNAIRIPVLGRVAAGLPLYVAEEIIDWEEIPRDWHGEYFGLKIQGHSMEPRICDGDVVIVRKQDYCDVGAIAIVLVNGDEATCKRVVWHDDGASLVSLNPVFPPKFYTLREINSLPVTIIGVVVELRGKL